MKSIQKFIEIPCNFCDHIIKVNKTNIDYSIKNNKCYYAWCCKCKNKNKLVKNDKLR
jgi:hypothetical protein